MLVTGREGRSTTAMAVFRRAGWLGLALAVAPWVMMAGMSKSTIYLGTYTRGASEGIYAVSFDSRTGSLGSPALVAAMPNPAFLALAPSGRQVYAVSESGTEVWAWEIGADARTWTLLGHRATGQAGPCHLVVDGSGSTVVVAHYTAGVVTALPIASNGSLGVPRSVMRHGGRSVHPTRQEASHPHSVTLSPDNRFIIVCDLGEDRVYSYALDAAAALLSPAQSPWVAAAPGAGPRHAAFASDGRHVFVLNELGNTLVAYRYAADTGALKEVGAIGTLPEGYAGESTTAEVKVHPHGPWVYASNRGHDSLAVLAFDGSTEKLSSRDLVPTGGRTPRNFALSPDGQWLVVANQNSHELRVFRCNPDTGELMANGDPVSVPSPVCVLFGP